jgi:hypothetical protein
MGQNIRQSRPERTRYDVPCTHVCQYKGISQLIGMIFVYYDLLAESDMVHEMLDM